jgi:hypothetical protein
MEHRVLASKCNLDMLSKDDSLLERTFTVDETWVSLYMAPDRNQARSWKKAGEKLEQVVSQNIHGDKRMLIMAMDFHGIAFWKIMPVNTTVDGNSYKSFLEEKVPQWLSSQYFSVPILLHDNARPHKAKVVKQYLEAEGIRLWNHPPYSPDMSPLDFNCFRNLKRRLRGIHHQSWEEFESALEIAVYDLNAQGSMNGVQQLPEKWRSCIEAEGSYFDN